ncbi:MAG: hypothetical protein UY52_C0014G0003 [Parcubacteria group bacterium GW2011_GWC2_49_9]|nr:MAG: hypothetical protein UY52_C0014G0003 [Parcubacteria group bacterium GW2011_GWC2_49_9]
MKKTLLFILSTLMGVALFIGVLHRIGIHEILETLRSFSWATLALIMLVGFLQLTVVLYRWQMVLRAQGDTVPGSVRRRRTRTGIRIKKGNGCAIYAWACRYHR